MAKKAFLSSLGRMGNRHLLGLLRAGLSVVGFDPNQESSQRSMETVRSNGLDFFEWVTEIPKGQDFDVAIFSETAKFRLQNLKTFLNQNQTARVLLEKPLSASPHEMLEIENVLKTKGLSGSATQVNFARRTWPIYHRLKALCAESKQVSVMLCGGAIGLGCNGIHFLDLFEFLCTSNEKSQVIYSQLSQAPVLSGRGKEFRDFGGHFLIQKGPHLMTASLSSESSSNLVFIVRGDHFMVTIDESDFSFRILQRSAHSDKPHYLYGQDYQVESEGKLELTPLDQVTTKWAEGKVHLPSFDEAKVSHALLFQILNKGGALEPYCFT